MSDVPQIDGNGMYNDVNVMEIDTDTPSETEKTKNKKNHMADLEQFFEPARHMKGDKRGRRRCKICA
jgi:hypothetical protein